MRLPLFAASLLALVSFPAPAAAQVKLMTRYGTHTQEYLGSDLDNVGDLDGDGYDEIAAQQRNSHFGGPLLWEWAIYSTADLSLRAVFFDVSDDIDVLRRVGDIDLDGFPDLALGRRFADVQGMSEAGRLTIVSGATGIPLFDVLGSQPKAWLAYGSPFGVADAQDVDQDGAPDLAVIDENNPGHNLFGRLHVLSGANASVLATLSGTAGNTVEGVQDFDDADGDGVPDLLVSRKAAGTGKRYLTVWSPGTGSTVKTYFDSGSIYFFQALSDMTGDGLPEVALGASDVRVLDIVSSAVIWSGTGLKLARGRPGDVDLDGFVDVIAFQTTSPPCEKTMVLSGATGNEIYAIEQTDPCSFNTGTMISDVVGDGRADLALSQRFDSPPGSSQGEYGSLSLFAKQGACGPVTLYGTVCPGTGGKAPLVHVTGCVGSPAALIVQWEGALPAAPGLLLVGQNKAHVPFMGCHLQVDPVLFALPWVGGAGSVSMIVPPGVHNATYTLQLFVLDPAGPQGLAASNGVELQFP